MLFVQTNTCSDRSVLEFVYENDNFVEDEDQKNKESEEDDAPFPKTKTIKPSVEYATKLIECWALFGNNGDEIRRSLNVILKKLERHFPETKK